MSTPLGLFEGFGVELEYMLVRQESLDVFPITDEILRAIAGEYTPEVELGAVAWSNELVLHVIELKTNGPAAELPGLADLFQTHVQRINELAAPHGALLMPTAMHPWMDPERETRLWPHEYNIVYESYNRIFDCRGHGWSNLQSTHLNLPFASDDEFGRLHTAIRLILPLLPALAASSPFADGRRQDWLDFRLETYRTNSLRIPLVTGWTIPERVYSQREYDEQILRPLYAAIAPYDPGGVLQHEWLNARGAIARFDRGAIEIRLLDIQECPQADLAIVRLIVATLRALVAERWAPAAAQRDWTEPQLHDLLQLVVREADGAVLASQPYRALFGWRGGPCSAGELWQHLREELLPSTSVDGALAPLDVIFREGCLARRLVRSAGAAPDRAAFAATYRRLCDCLATGSMFHA